MCLIFRSPTAASDEKIETMDKKAEAMDDEKRKFAEMDERMQKMGGRLETKIDQRTIQPPRNKTDSLRIELSET
ncbi:hypothetical protein [Parageobacillus thermoglucosidasius]|uniref:Uncharacterized protein n=1 Tax=Parageobacillus thermoglucosidasius TaxID=1426 RepID=A0AB38R3K1_PARTM|nr:hypothetical protein [Parageobacillus thermoglucosidasius]UOE77618.1 hypothetical protein IMI45_07395 [Parageobacillus thermoglucosidasius]